jgi:hypothetical protein
VALSDHPATSIDGEVRFVAQLSRPIVAGHEGRLWIGLAHVSLLGELTSPFSFSKVVIASIVALQFARIPGLHPRVAVTRRGLNQTGVDDDSLTADVPCL